LEEKIRWAPKVPRAKIWQMYQNDVLGAVDEDLVTDIGYRLLNRIQSIWQVTHGQVACPRCGDVYALQGDLDNWRFSPGPHACPTPGCGFSVTLEDWHKSWSHRDLLGMAAKDAMQTYLRDYPRARSVSERMLCIDLLIHAFHISLQSGKLNRSFANNLIEGSHQQVLDLLDKLFAIPGGVDKTGWRESVQKMRRRRMGEDE